MDKFNMKLKILLISSILFFSANLFAADLHLPLLYPKKVVTIKKPHLVWQDSYIELNMEYPKFLITVTDRSNPKKGDYQFSIAPDIYFKEYYFFQVPINLKDSTYDYKIERLVGNSPLDLKYYYYMKYPIIGQFTLDSSKKNPMDTLSPENLIKYQDLYIKNKINAYHFWFLSASSSVFLGLGFVFLYATDFGIYSTITYSICFGTAGAGFIAAAYFGIRYLINLSKLKKILKLGKRVSIGGSFNGERFFAEAKMNF